MDKKSIPFNKGITRSLWYNKAMRISEKTNVLWMTWQPNEILWTIRGTDTVKQMIYNTQKKRGRFVKRN